MFYSQKYLQATCRMIKCFDLNLKVLPERSLLRMMRKWIMVIIFTCFTIL